MNLSRILGIICLVTGLLVLGFGLNSSQALTERAVEKVTGRYTDNTMWYLVGGAALIVGGGALALTGRRRED